MKEAAAAPGRSWLDAARCLVIAHRGASAEAPENTLAAFRLAIDRGADGIELDVRASGDGHLVVIHDATVDRVTGAEGEIAALTLAALRRLDAGAGQRIPTLAEVLDLARGRLLVDIELKITGVEPQVLALVREFGMERDVLITSFHEEAVAAVRRLASDVATGLLQQRPAPGRAVALGTPVYLPPIGALSDGLMAECRRLGLRVIPWTIRREEEAKTALRLGVAGMIADDPRLVRSVLAQAQA
ncbi:MAG: glycerophosphodiester phosphodiesterase family protein [Armatimonadota bacterium]|nr:glycerophosphodiester phosphodiesterase family protein [Armatimonadota bacterium]